MQQGKEISNSCQKPDFYDFLHCNLGPSKPTQIDGICE